MSGQATGWRAWRAQLRWIAWGLVLHMPRMGTADWQWLDVLALSGEWCVLVALAGALGRRRGVGPALGCAWVGLLLLESVRLAGWLLTAADPQLYDLAFLARHLWVLMMDLWGPLQVAASLLALVLGVAGLCGLASWRLEDVVADRRTARVAGVLTAACVGFGLLPWHIGAHWVSPAWVANLVESRRTWQLTQASVAVDHYAPLMDVEALQHRPDIGLYVVESYGRVLDTTPSLNASWRPLLDELSPGLIEQGWHMASGWATAPVSGGRSWISDATVMLGISIRHQSTWSHIQPKVGTLTHLPGWLAASGGYETVVCRPKDRVRLGLALRNDFDWQHTVFADDIPYDGPLVGWGGIPDQYSLGHLHTQVLPAVQGPRLVFFHGVSAHGPWDVVPELAHDWRAVGEVALQAVQGVDAVVYEESENPDAVLKVQARRYSPTLGDRFKLPGRMFPEKRREYMNAVDYSLRATMASLSLLPETPRGRLVVVYGDHQPPILPRKGEYDVPVHVLASDPRLLDAFLDAGFVAGLHPDAESEAMPLEALFPTLAAAVLGRPATEVPGGVSLADLLEAGP